MGKQITIALSLEAMRVIRGNVPANKELVGARPLEDGTYETSVDREVYRALIDIAAPGETPSDTIIRIGSRRQ